MVLANARLILPGEVVTGSLRISGGVIAAIDTGAAVPRGAIDCGGDHIAPGLVELHTDNLERHLTPRPKVDWPHGAAILAHDRELAGTGITTVFDAIRVGSIVSDAENGYPEYARAMASEIAAASRDGLLKIDHRIHLRAEVCSETLVDELAAFGREDGIGIVSLMDHTPGQRQFRDVEKLRVYLAGKAGLTDEGFAAHMAFHRDLRARNGDAHEAATVAAARRYGAVLASHDDTTADQVAVSARHGVALAEFPTTTQAASASRAAGLAVIMGAPNLVRGGSHSGNVAASELAHAGHLDILSSDYVPASLLMGAVRLGDIWGDLARGIACVTRNPAERVGLHDRGRLAPGLRADSVALRPARRRCGRPVGLVGRAAGGLTTGRRCRTSPSMHNATKDNRASVP